MDIIKLLNELEYLIENTRTIGMGFAYNFHADDYQDLTNKIRASLPDDVKKASRVTAESEQIVDGAREAAEQTLDDATAEAEHISREARLNAERMLRDVEAQANKMTLSAEATAKLTVNEARAKAEQMLADAHQQSQKMISQSEVVRLATAQAHEIVAAAEREARESAASAEREARDLRHGADEYAFGVMADLERQVGELMGTIQRGRQKLDQRVGVQPPSVATVVPGQNGRVAGELAAARR